MEEKEGGPEWNDPSRRRPSSHKSLSAQTAYAKYNENFLYEFLKEERIQKRRRAKRMESGIQKLMHSVGVKDLTHPFVKVTANIDKDQGDDIAVISDLSQAALSNVNQDILSFDQPILTVQTRRDLRSYEFNQDTQYDSEKEQADITAFQQSEPWNGEDGHIFNSRRFRSDFRKDGWDKETDEAIVYDNSDDDNDSFLSKRKDYSQFNTSRLM